MCDSKARAVCVTVRLELWFMIMNGPFGLVL